MCISEIFQFPLGGNLLTYFKTQTVNVRRYAKNLKESTFDYKQNGVANSVIKPKGPAWLFGPFDQNCDKELR